MNPVLIVTGLVGPQDEPAGRVCRIWCPGCDDLHCPLVAGENGDVPLASPCWEWDGNLTAPTFSPSLLVFGNGGSQPGTCHSFIKNGQWEFLSDSAHHLSGQMVPMVPLPDWIMP